MDEEIGVAARRAFDAARAQGLRVVTAESCTGGLVAAALTDIPGASDVLERGFVTYSNDAKEAVLGVPSTVLQHHGAVSREAAEAMAHGAIIRSPADVSVAITGIAGPGGGTPTKPVGLVHFAAMRRDGPLIHRERRYGDIGRAEIRRQSVIEALSMVAALASGRQ